MICDEAHCIKNTASARYKCVASLAALAQRVVLLTGTPIQVDPRHAQPDRAHRTDANYLARNMYTRHLFSRSLSVGLLS